MLAPLVTHNAFLGQMPNDALVDRILALTTDVTPSERLVLKIAAALIKQLNEDNYEIQRDSDPRIKLSAKEFDMVPDCFEMWNGIPRPKHWSTPERMAAIEKEKREIGELEKQFNGDRDLAMQEYFRRISERSRS